MPESYPRAVLKLQGSTKPHEHRVLVAVDGEIVGEVPASSARVEFAAGDVPRLVVEVLVNERWAEVDLTTPTSLDGVLDRVGDALR